jgi:hypothetical protein
MRVARDQLFSKSGHPCQGLRYCLDNFECKTLEELQAKVAAGDVSLREIYRIRGNGSEYNPGKLPQFLFGVPSRDEMVRQRILNNLGDGI